MVDYKTVASSTLMQGEDYQITSALNVRGKLLLADSKGGLIVYTSNTPPKRYLGAYRDTCIRHLGKIKHGFVTVDAVGGSIAQTAATNVASASAASLFTVPDVVLDDLVPPANVASSFSKSIPNIKLWHFSNNDDDTENTSNKSPVPKCVKRNVAFKQLESIHFTSTVITCMATGSSSSSSSSSSLSQNSEQGDEITHIALGFFDGSILWIRATANFNQVVFLPSSSAFSISGIHFNREFDHVWIVEPTRIKVVSFDGRTQTFLTKEEGSNFDCNTTFGKNGGVELAVGRNDMIACYTLDNAASCYSFPGVKSFVTSLRNQLVMVSSGSKLWLNNPNEMILLQIFDPTNKYLSFEMKLNESVLFIAPDDTTGSIYLIFNSKTILKLGEKDLSERIEVLINKNLYNLAENIIIATTSSNNSELLLRMEIVKLNADHLYDKGHFEEAVQEYVKTIGFLEISYVIKKFIEKVEYLAIYLENVLLEKKKKREKGNVTDLVQVGFTSSIAVQEGEEKNNANITSLLLHCYIKLKNDSKLAKLLKESKTNHVEVDSALALLSGTGNLKFALNLAMENKRHAWYVKVLLLEEKEASSSSWLSALEYIRNNIADEPAIQLELLYEHCAFLLNVLPMETTQLIGEIYANNNNNNTLPQFEMFIDVYCNHSNELLMLIQKYLSSGVVGSSSSSSLVWTTLLELCLKKLNQTTTTTTTQQRGNDGSNEEGGELLIMNILRDPKSKYDASLVLSLLNEYGHLEGQMFLHEKMKSYDLLLETYMKHEMDDKITNFLMKHLPNDEASWMKVLVYFIRKKQTDRIQICLRHVSAHETIPPLMILRLFNENGGGDLSLKVVKSYVCNQIDRSLKQAQANEKEIHQLKLDTMDAKKQIKRLTEDVVVFKNVKDSMTGGALDFPTVHFLTSNSYNLSSLNRDHLLLGNDRMNTLTLMDPMISPQQESIMEISKGLIRRNQDIDEEFFTELANTQKTGGEAGYSLISDYFSKCLFQEKE